MKINDYGQVILNSQDIFEGLYSGKLTSLQDLNIDDSNIIEQFNHARAENADPVKPLTVFQQTLDSIKDFDNNLYIKSHYFGYATSSIKVDSFL